MCVRVVLSSTCWSNSCNSCSPGSKVGATHDVYGLWWFVDLAWKMRMFLLTLLVVVVVLLHGLLRGCFLNLIIDQDFLM